MVDGPVVVGVDGSEAAVTAVRWAARTAALRRVPLRLVHAFTTVPPGRFGDPGRSEPYRRRLVEAGEAALGAATRSARAVAPGLEVRAEEHEGFPVGVLLAASRRATQTVVGSRGLGGVTDLLAGSVAMTLAARGESPVVVVRGRVTDTPDGGSRAPVVVGVDGSPTSEAALGLALEEASLRDAPLLAVHCWLDHPMAPATALRTDGAALAAEEHALLGERLAGWSQKYPDVEIRRLVERRRAAPALLEASDRAQLVVVGSRGRGGAAGLALGSVSHALIHRARCPVLVARPAEEDRDVPDVR